MRKIRAIRALLCVLLLYGCSGAAANPAAQVQGAVSPTFTAAVEVTAPAPIPSATALPQDPSGTPAANTSPSPTSAVEMASSPTAPATDQPQAAQSGATPQPASTRKPPKYWAEWPLIPDNVSERAKTAFLLGQQLGNDPHAFSVIGDCQSQPNIFMGMYDKDSYTLPPDGAGLAETIQQFKGSFGRESITVKDGESVASVLTAAWADPKQCEKGESALDCEFRVHKPIIVFINLGTNWNGGDDVKHEQYLRKIVDYALAKGVVPIISSKGDNLEGDHRINQSNARVAYDYDLPFWNFWLSIRNLPGKGIDGTRPGGYLIPDAWPIRSETGLKALDAVWKELKSLLK